MAADGEAVVTLRFFAAAGKDDDGADDEREEDDEDEARRLASKTFWLGLRIRVLVRTFASLRPQKASSICTESLVAEDEIEDDPPCWDERGEARCNSEDVAEKDGNTEDEVEDSVAMALLTGRLELGSDDDCTADDDDAKVAVSATG